jgi:hypothetical protein
MDVTRVNPLHKICSNVQKKRPHDGYQKRPNFGLIGGDSPHVHCAESNNNLSASIAKKFFISNTFCFSSASMCDYIPIFL